MMAVSESWSRNLRDGMPIHIFTFRCSLRTPRGDIEVNRFLHFLCVLCANGLKAGLRPAKCHTVRFGQSLIPNA